MKSLNIYFVSACITNINTVMFRKAKKIGPEPAVLAHIKLY